MVSNAHGHTEFEAKPSGLERSRQPSHSAHILGNGNSVRIKLFHEHCGQCQISNGIFIYTCIEIIVISDEVLAQAVVPIQHTRDTVEPESVQMILFHPELAVGQEEIFGFTLSVVEASGAPRRMASLGSLIEIQVFPAVEQAEPFRLIVHAVGMDDIHHDGYAAGMCIIHKMFEFLRCSESGGKCVEVGRAIIWMVS